MQAKEIIFREVRDHLQNKFPQLEPYPTPFMSGGRQDVFTYDLWMARREIIFFLKNKYPKISWRRLGEFAWTESKTVKKYLEEGRNGYAVYEKGDGRRVLVLKETPERVIRGRLYDPQGKKYARETISIDKQLLTKVGFKRNVYKLG